MLTWRFAVHLNRSLVGLLGIVIEKTDVAYLRSFPCVVVKKTFQVTCGDPETEVDLILSRAGIFETPKDIDDFTICPTHRSNLGNSVGWIRGSISRCRVPKEVYGHGKGRVKSIPKADWGIGKRVPQIVSMTSGKFILPPCAKLCIPSDLGLDWELVNTHPVSTYAATETTISDHKSDIFKYCLFNIKKIFIQGKYSFVLGSIIA